jgi:hypothetical protein
MARAIINVDWYLGSDVRSGFRGPIGEVRRNPSARHIHPRYSICLDVRRPGTPFRAVGLVSSWAISDENLANFWHFCRVSAETRLVKSLATHGKLRARMPRSRRFSRGSYSLRRS